MIKLPPKTWEYPNSLEMIPISTGGEPCLMMAGAMPLDSQQNTWIVKVLEQIVEHLNDKERAPFKDVYHKEMDEAFTKDLNV